jgi:integrase
MAAKWIKSQYPGIRYREHPDRRHGAGPDKYLVLTYKWEGKTRSESIGWVSKTRITEKDASFILADLQRNQRTGEGPRTLAEKRQWEDQARQDERQRREEEAKARAARAHEDRLQTITLGQVWAPYSEEASRTKKPSTWEREAQLWADHIEPELVRVPMVKITPFLLAKVQRKILDKGRAPRTAFYALQVIRQVFNWAKAQDPQLYTGDNPVTHTKKVKLNNKRTRFLSHDEATALLAALKKGGHDNHATHDITLISLHCGLRFGEIARLRWRDIDSEDGSIHIRQSKSGVSRVVYMTGDLKEMFKARPQGGPDDLIFPARGGGVRKQISKFFNQTVKGLGFNKGETPTAARVSFHTCRHSCASWMVMAGVDLYKVQKILGHSDHSMTTRYSHLAPDSIRQASKVLEDSLQQSHNGRVVHFEKKL